MCVCIIYLYACVCACVFVWGLIWFGQNLEDYPGVPKNGRVHPITMEHENQPRDSDKPMLWHSMQCYASLSLCFPKPRLVLCVDCLVLMMMMIIFIIIVIIIVIITIIIIIIIIIEAT